MPERAGRLAALALLLAGGCATTSERDEVAVPAGNEQIYVAVFVDETDRGEVGLKLTEAIQIEIWQRDPGALAQTFERGTAAIDGTVVSLEEIPAGDGEYELRVRSSAVLVDKRGRKILTIDLAEARARYRIQKERARTEAARQEALDQAVRDMARHIVQQIDAAGRASAAGEGGAAA